MNIHPELLKIYNIVIDRLSFNSRWKLNLSKWFLIKIIKMYEVNYILARLGTLLDKKNDQITFLLEENKQLRDQLNLVNND